VLLPPHPGLVDERVVAGDLFDHAHDAAVVAVALEVAPVGAPDALVLRRRLGAGFVTVVVAGGGEERLLRLGDLAEDLLLGIEVVVEGAVREPGTIRDVGDPCLEEAGYLEYRLRRLQQAGAGRGPLA
jgi:hypothetical protein